MLRLLLITALAATSLAQVRQENARLSPEVVEKLDAKVRHPLLKLAPEEFKKEMVSGKIRYPDIEDIENKTVSAVCKCDNGKVPAEVGDVIELSGFRGDETAEEMCEIMCNELEKGFNDPNTKRRRKRQIGLGYGGFGGFGFGGFFNGLPVGYGGMGFNLMGAGGILGLGGCGYSCSANLCGGGYGPGFGPGFGGFGLGAAAPLPALGFDSFGASLGGFGVSGVGAANAALVGSGFFGGVGLGLGGGMCWGCQRNWLPPPIAPLPVVRPITVPRYVDVPVPRPVSVPIVRRVDVPVMRPVAVPRPVYVPVVRRVDVPVVRQVSIPRPVPVPMPVIRPVSVPIPAPQPLPVRRVIQVRRVLRLRPAVRKVQGVVAIPVSGVALRAAQTGSTSWSSGGMTGLNLGGLSAGGMSLSGLSGLTSGMSSMSSMGSIPVPTDAGAYAGGASSAYPAGAYPVSGTDAATYYGAGSSGSAYYGGGAYPVPKKTTRT